MATGWLGTGLGETLRVAIRWAHALAAIAWIGGALFYLLAFRPAMRAAGATEWAAALERAVGARFREIVEVSVIILAVSGAVLTFDRLSSGAAGSWYVVLLGVKVALALAMFGLAWELGWAGRLRRGGYAGQRRASPVVGGWLSPSRLVLGLGLTVVLLAIVIRHLFEAGLRAGAGS